MLASLESSDGRLAGIPANRVVLRCSHGTSQVFVVPGANQAASLAVLDLLRARHSIRHRCHCAEVTHTSAPAH